MAAGKAMAMPLLILNLLMYLIVLGIAGWALNRFIDNAAPAGNNATYPFILMSLIAGAIGVASILAGLHHLKAWRGESGAAAGASALIAWLLTLLAFALACKEIHTSGRDRRLRVLEAFVIILAVFQLIYLLLLHAGLFSSRYGPGYSNYGAGYGGHHIGDTHKTAAPAV